jgi:hypothetical protein
LLLTKLVLGKKQEVKAEGFNLDAGIELLDVVMQSDMFGAIQQLFMSLVSAKLVNKDVSDYLSPLFEGNTPLHIIKNVLVATCRVIAVSGLIYQGVCLSKSLFRPNPLKAIRKDINNLLSYHGRVSNSHTDGMSSMSTATFEQKYQEVSSIYEAMTKTYIKHSKEFEGIARDYIQLSIMRDEILVSDSTYRKAPLGFIAYGDPGVGKSSIVKAVSYAVAAVLNVDEGVNIVYPRTMSSEYWDQYEPLLHKVIHLSEVGNAAPRLVSQRGDPVLAELCSLCDSVPFSPNMAAVDKKGRIRATPVAVVADTNCKDLNANVATGHPAAIYRRFYFIEVKVKGGVRGQGCGIDPVKAMNAHLDDIWDFSVSVRQPTDSVRYVENVILEGPFSVLMEWMLVTINSHVQDTSDNSLNEYLRATVQFMNTQRVKNMRVLDNVSSYGSDGSDSIESKEAKSAYAEGDDVSEKGRGYICPDPVSNYTLDSQIPGRWRYRRDDERKIQEYMDESNPDVDRWRQFLLSHQHIWDNESIELDAKSDSDMSDDEDAVHPVVVRDGWLTRCTSMIKCGAKSIIGGGRRLYNRSICAYSNHRRTHCRLYGKMWLACEASMLSSISFAEHLYVVCRGPEYKNCVTNEFQFILGFMVSLIFASLLFNSSSVAGAGLCTVFVICGLIISFCSVDFYQYGINMGYSKLRGRKSDRAKAAELAWKAFFDEVKDPFVAHHLINYVAVGAGLLSALGTYMVVKAAKKAIETQSEGISKDPELRTEEIVMDAKDSYERIGNQCINSWNLMVKPLPICADFGGNKANFLNIICRNVRRARIHNDTSLHYSHVFGVVGQLAIIHRHVLPLDYPYTIAFSASGKSDDSSYTLQTLITGTQDVRIIHDDLALVKLSNVTTFKDVRKYIVQDVVRIGSGSVLYDDVKFNLYKDPIQAKAKNYSPVYSPSYSYVWQNHASGKCGYPLICEVDGRFGIIGLHSAGLDNSNMCFAIPLGACNISDAINSFSETLCESLEIIPTVKPGPNSMVRYLPLESVQYMGKVDGYKVLPNQSSKIQTTVFGDGKAYDIRQFFIERGIYDLEYFSKPMMKHRTVDGLYMCPYQNNVAKMCVEKKGLDRQILLKCVDAFLDHVTSLLPRELRLQPWTVDVAINGALYDAYARKVNIATSAGFGYPGKKNLYFDLNESGSLEMVPKLRNAVLDRLRALDTDKIYPQIYVGNLKDEVVTAEKAAIGKTRMFYGGSLPDLVVARILLGPLYTLMMEYRSVFCTAIGIDTHREALSLLQQIGVVDDQGEIIEDFVPGDGDFSNYDKSMPEDIAWAVSKFFSKLAKYMGYNDISMVRLERLLYSMQQPWVVILGGLFILAGLKPSGAYGTTEDNGVRNVIMWMYCYYLVFKRVDNFFDNVKIATNGDDVIAGFRAVIANNFNCKVFGDLSYVHIGVKFTPASKSGEVKPFTSVQEISFLKRTFVRHNGKWEMPLDKSSFIKMLGYRQPSRSVTKEEQLTATAFSALYEIYFHRDIDFDEFRNHLISGLVAMVFRVITLKISYQQR